MKFNIILIGTGGELNRVQVDNGGGDDLLDTHQWVPAIESWVLADGDLIRISAVEE